MSAEAVAFQTFSGIFADLRVRPSRVEGVANGGRGRIRTHAVPLGSVALNVDMLVQPNEGEEQEPKHFPGKPRSCDRFTGEWPAYIQGRQQFSVELHGPPRGYPAFRPLLVGIRYLLDPTDVPQQLTYTLPGVAPHRAELQGIPYFAEHVPLDSEG